MVQPMTDLDCIAPRLKACTTCYCTKQHRSNLSTRENDVIEKCGEQEMYEAAANVTNTSYCFTVNCFFFLISRKSAH